MSDLATTCADLIRLAAEATPGPWEETCGDAVSAFRPEDERFMVFARTAAPQLAALVAALLPEIERLREAMAWDECGRRPPSASQAAAGSLLAAFDRVAKP